jgi:hypothetical protein
MDSLDLYTILWASNTSPDYTEKSRYLSTPALFKVSLATGYLPRQSPAKYCRCWHVSLPCSVWVRVGPRRLATKEYTLTTTQKSFINNRYVRVKPSTD